MNARTQPEWSEKLTVGSSEAAHLFRRLRARTLKMLSVKRGRAGRLDVEAPPSSSALDRHSAERVFSHGGDMNLCGETLSGLVRHRARRVESASVQTPF